MALDIDGKTLRRLRTRAGLSHHDLAQRAQVRRESLAGMEEGTHRPHMDTLVRIARALDVDTRELLRRPRVARR